MAIKVEGFKADTILNVLRSTKMGRGSEGRIEIWTLRPKKTERGIKANNKKVGNFFTHLSRFTKAFYYLSLQCKHSLHVITTF